MIQEITKHPFSKVKPPKGPKIEDIFIKGKQPKSLERKNNTAKQSNKKKKFKKKI